jgi:hypothetical protein
MYTLFLLPVPVGGVAGGLATAVQHLWDRVKAAATAAATAASRPPRHRLWWSTLMASVVLTALAPAARATVSCSAYASPSGTDQGPGTIQQPFRTAQELVNSLRPGQTGCLRAGTYYEALRFGRAGTASAPITLAGYPGEKATVVGRMYIPEGADYTTVTGLYIDGSNPNRLPSPTIDSNHVTFSFDDVTNDHTGICFAVGSATWGWSTDTLITHSRIHDCGQLPPTNYNHGLYIGGATDTTVEWNLIYANADRGIQLYPDAQYTTIDHNIIDDNGEGILVAGGYGAASSHTNVYDNAITNATMRHDVEAWWPSGNPVGVDNIVQYNCVWGGREGTIDTSAGGLIARKNLVADPLYVDAQDHDYEMRPDSPCLSRVGDVQAAVDGPGVLQAPGVLQGARPTADVSSHARKAKHRRRRRTAHGHSG